LRNTSIAEDQRALQRELDFIAAIVIEQHCGDSSKA
jgi:hypothetical protein